VHAGNTPKTEKQYERRALQNNPPYYNENPGKNAPYYDNIKKLNSYREDSSELGLIPKKSPYGFYYPYLLC
jgi:hypothetical protein